MSRPHGCWRRAPACAAWRTGPGRTWPGSRRSREAASVTRGSPRRLSRERGRTGGNSPRSRWLLERRPRPEVAGEGDAEAPGDGLDRVTGGRVAVEQPAHGLDDRREGLVLGELPQARAHL